MNRQQMEAHLTLKGWVWVSDTWFAEPEPTMHNGTHVVWIEHATHEVRHSNPADLTPAGYSEYPEQPWSALPDDEFWLMVECAREMEWL